VITRSAKWYGSSTLATIVNVGSRARLRRRAGVEHVEIGTRWRLRPPTTWTIRDPAALRHRRRADDGVRQLRDVAWISSPTSTVTLGRQVELAADRASAPAIEDLARHAQRVLLQVEVLLRVLHHDLAFDLVHGLLVAVGRDVGVGVIDGDRLVDGDDSVDGRFVGRKAREEPLLFDRHLVGDRRLVELEDGPLASRRSLIVTWRRSTSRA
jgi:hypothetical protein